MRRRRPRVEALWVFRFFGRRGLALLYFGGLLALIGLGVLLQPQSRFTPPPGSTDAPRVTPLTLLDHPMLGLLWIAAGLAAIVGSTLRKARGGSDAWAFNSLLAPPFLWFLGHVWSFVAWLMSGGDLGRATGWVSAVVWFSFSAFIILIAGWPDPDDPAIRAPRPENKWNLSG